MDIHGTDRERICEYRFGAAKIGVKNQNPKGNSDLKTG